MAGGTPQPQPGVDAAWVRRAARDAEARIRPHVATTPVDEVSLPLAGGRPLLVKAEHRQHTGSFKVRGALARLTAEPGPAPAVVAASSGNHGLGVAYALSVLGGRGVILVPDGASAAKVAAIEALGVEVRRVGSADALAAEHAARDHARRTGDRYVSPYDDRHVVSGQATVALELVAQVDPPPDEVVVAVGGGGLVSGIAAVLAAAWPGTRVVGASPRADAAMAASVAAGRVVEVAARPTFSDGTAGGVDPGAVTVGLCRDLVSEWVLVDEVDIAEAVVQAGRRYAVVEGAAGVALAAAGARVRAHPTRRVLAVSCGGNVDPATLERMARAVSDRRTQA